ERARGPLPTGECPGGRYVPASRWNRDPQRSAPSQRCGIARLDPTRPRRCARAAHPRRSTVAALVSSLSRSGYLTIAVHTEPHPQFIELLDVPIVRRMDVFRFGQELDLVVARNAVAGEDFFKTFERPAVGDEQLMFVELDFLRSARVQNGDPGAAVVHQQVFKIVENTLEHRHVDVLAIE